MSSFKKKAPRLVLPDGTKTSIHNNQLLVSSGVPSLDDLFGGGIPVGTLLLIEEDKYTTYSQILLRYFLGEGIAAGHEIFLASAENDPAETLVNIPAFSADPKFEAKDETEETKDTAASLESMKIAWRYENLPKVQSARTSFTRTAGQEAVFGHYFDLSQKISAKHLESAAIRTLHLPPSEAKPYSATLDAIKSVLGERHRVTSTLPAGERRTIVRLALQSLGSSWWSSEEEDDRHLLPFLHSLRGVLRSTFSVCLVTVPAHVLSSPQLARSAEHLADAVFAVHSFAGTPHDKNPQFKDYHGFFQIKKLPRLNSLMCQYPETLDQAFKLRRRKFVIEKLHLPPDLSDNAARSQEDAVPTMSCSSGGGGKNLLDF
eukprot:Colp12_sorted_trinity150504_noHs@32895